MSVPDPPALQLPPGRRVRLGRRGTTFVREMPGPPGAPVLVLLHGLGATAGINWAACFGRLGQSFRVVALDQRGHGRGIRSTMRPFRLVDCADDVVALADVLGIARVFPVGYSMGGPVAQLVVHRHPDRVAGMVLCATARNFRGTRRPMFAEAVFDGGLVAAATALRMVPVPVRRGVVRAGLNRRLVDNTFRTWAMGEVANHDPASLVEAARELGRFSSAAWIGDVTAPTSVVVTEFDQLVPPARQYKLAGAIPGAEVFPVEGDHGVCITDPRAFVPVLVDACRAVSNRAGAPL